MKTHEGMYKAKLPRCSKQKCYTSENDKLKNGSKITRWNTEYICRRQKQTKLTSNAWATNPEISRNKSHTHKKKPTNLITIDANEIGWDWQNSRTREKEPRHPMEWTHAHMRRDTSTEYAPKQMRLQKMIRELIHDFSRQWKHTHRCAIIPKVPPQELEGIQIESWMKNRRPKSNARQRKTRAMTKKRLNHESNAILQPQFCLRTIWNLPEWSDAISKRQTSWIFLAKKSTNPRGTNFRKNKEPRKTIPTLIPCSNNQCYIYTRSKSFNK